MKPFCMTFVGDILPVVKAVMARKMLTDYKLSQTKIAEILEMTQPAISQYKRSLRGSRFELLEKDEKTLDLIGELTRQLALGELSEAEKDEIFCKVCRSIRENKRI
ncbi:MAG: hypothetical protein GXO64_04060 [Candidatus Micrarchaeota archaeon]|nr:hypothetical protein [Candidatus Micrarchaeota archaeon]